MNPLAAHVPSNKCTKCTATNYNAVSSLCVHCVCRIMAWLTKEKMFKFQCTWSENPHRIELLYYFFTTVALVNTGLNIDENEFFDDVRYVICQLGGYDLMCEDI